MNYQQKRHYEMILANNLKGPAHAYRAMAEAQRMQVLQLRELSREVLGHDNGTFEQVIEGVRAVSARVDALLHPPITGTKPTHFVVDEVFDDGRPAKKGARNVRRS